MAAVDTPRAGGGPSILIVDDHPALRDGLEVLLAGKGIRVVGSTGGMRNALALARARRPDVIVLDLGLRERNGVELTTQLIAADPGCRVLVYSGEDDPERIRGALAAGAVGFAHKQMPVPDLAQAIKRVADGEAFMDPHIGNAVLRAAADVSPSVLTGRERQVLQLLARGLTGASAAAELGLAPETVRGYIKNAVRKLDAQTRTHAVALALAHHEIET